jgi:hypothetical protein
MTMVEKENQAMIIGLCGPAGAGKDTVRSILVQQHDFLGLAFADPVRAMVRALLEMVGSQWHMLYSMKEQPAPVIGASYRMLAQTLGTEWGRKHLGDDVWVNIAMYRMRVHKDCGYRRFVFSDVRFPNEMAAIREEGGQIWAVTRPGIEPVRAHVPEEMARDAVHFADKIINNDGTIADLERAVSAALQNNNEI